MFSLTVFSSLIARHWPLWPLMSCIRRDLSETSQCWSFTRRERAGKMRSPCPFTMRKARLVCPSLSWFHTSYFLHGTDWGEVSNGLPSEAQGKNKPLQTQRFHLLQNTCFLFQNPFYKIAKKQLRKGYPLSGPWICNSKLELAFAIINNLLVSPVYFSFFFLF